MNGPTRLRQHGTILSFFTTLWLGEPQFCEKDQTSSAPPEAISPVKTRERLLHARIGRFAVFAHVVVFVVQTSTA